jgi:glycosyltransferase involved in cell wall biosynthesis
MVDDGSSDDSREIFNRVAQNDPRFRLLVNNKNQGESYSVNKGWSKRRENLISILSCDDPQPNDWLAKMITFRKENPGFIVYYPNRIVIDENSKTLRHEFLFDWSESLLTQDLLCVVSVGAIIDSSLLPSNFKPRIPEVVFPSDLVQYLKLSIFGIGLRHPSYFSVWREHRSSKSAEGKRVLAKEFNKGMQIYLRSINEDQLVVKESAIFANVVRILQGEYSFLMSFILGLRIYLSEFDIRSLSVPDLFKILVRFRRRRNTRGVMGF